VGSWLQVRRIAEAKHRHAAPNRLEESIVAAFAASKHSEARTSLKMTMPLHRQKQDRHQLELLGAAHVIGQSPKHDQRPPFVAQPTVAVVFLAVWERMEC
jgi:hypothetical protein